jgi:hypothetical protein
MINNTNEWNSEVDWQVKMANARKKNNSELEAIGDSPLRLENLQINSKK